jgi:hypothetical protein
MGLKVSPGPKANAEMTFVNFWGWGKKRSGEA